MPIVRLSCLIAFLTLALAAPAQEPQTVAESSDYARTSTDADVLAFCEALAKQSRVVLLPGAFGTSKENRAMPLLVLADPPIKTPEEAAKSGKLVVFIQANIHAGEVDGKEGVLMLARDFAQAKVPAPWMKDLIVVIAPDVNPDGNEKFAKHRPEQNGPVQVGTRENSQGFDLNRDFVKLESPEGRAMVRAYRRWNASVIMDMHTTNGSLHRYPLTYDSPRHPGADPDLIQFAHDVLLPDAGKRLEKNAGIPSFYYGNFNRDHSRWEAYRADVRMGTPYAGLRNRIGILSESYSYADFRTRVKASREFARACLESIAENADKIRKLISEAEKPIPKIAIRHKLVARPNLVTVHGYEESVVDGKRVAGNPKDYLIPHFAIGEATAFAQRPIGYLIPAKFTSVIENLQRQGIALEELREDIELSVQADSIDSITKADREFQNHRFTSLQTIAKAPVMRRIPAGTVLVRTDQPLGRLAVFLLEPNSDDGLTLWNFFDSDLKVNEEFPVVRLVKDAPILTGRVRPLGEERPALKTVTPDHATGKIPPPNFVGNPIHDLKWLPDGEHFLQVKKGALWRVHAASGRAVPFFDAAKLVDAIAKIPSLSASIAKEIAGRTGFNMNPQATGFLFDHGNDLYFAAFDGSKAVRLTKTPAAEELATFSPNGEWVAFVREQNLYVVDLATQTERKLTVDGGGRIFNGKADWVYYEEVFNRSEHAFWWSPDSRHIAFLRIDDTPVAPFTVVDNIPVHQKLEPTLYPQSGDPNPIVKLGIVGVDGGDVHFADLSGYTPNAILLFRACWTPDSERVFLYVTDRAQTWLDLWAIPHGTTAPVKLFREKTKAWVDDPGDPIFLNDGSFLFLSERSGWKHLYHYEKDGKVRRQVTSGPWEVRHVHVVDQTAGQIYLSATVDSPIAVNLYQCPLNGGTPVALTSGADHQIQTNSKGAHFFDTYSSHATPVKVSLIGRDGKTVRVLDTNPVYVLDEYQFGKFELVKIPMKDGFVLEGSVLLPPNYDPEKKYPAWFMTYAGPHTPTISDSWSSRVMDHALASLGIIVFRADPRSASGKGAESAWTAYRNLGIQELKDIEEAIDWLVKCYPVDAAKIGMSGHSYGGFMTSFALTHSKKFCAGIAGAPVTDWKNYDTIYTERFMNTPQENPEGYANTSVVAAAKNLHGRLLILHGLMDDNVHVQNSVQLIDALQRANADFEVMVYPKARHGIFGPHYQKTVFDFIRKSLNR